MFSDEVMIENVLHDLTAQNKPILLRDASSIHYCFERISYEVTERSLTGYLRLLP
jgi:hypothetical protein